MKKHLSRCDSYHAASPLKHLVNINAMRKNRNRQNINLFCAKRYSQSQFEFLCASFQFFFPPWLFTTNHVHSCNARKNRTVNFLRYIEWWRSTNCYFTGSFFWGRGRFHRAINQNHSKHACTPRMSRIVQEEEIFV